MVTCCVEGCTSRTSTSGPKIPNISFYRFPTDPVLRKRWLNRINRKDFSPTIHSRVCSRHFQLNSAVPSIFPKGTHIPKRRNVVKNIPFLEVNKENIPPPKCRESIPEQKEEIPQSDFENIPSSSKSENQVEIDSEPLSEDNTDVYKSSSSKSKNQVENDSEPLSKDNTSTCKFSSSLPQSDIENIPSSSKSENQVEIDSEPLSEDNTYVHKSSSSKSKSQVESDSEPLSKDKTPVCKFFLAQPFLLPPSEHVKGGAISFSTVCPNCQCRFSCLVDKVKCKEHSVSNRIETATQDDLVILDLPDDIKPTAETINANNITIVNVPISAPDIIVAPPNCRESIHEKKREIPQSDVEDIPFSPKSENQGNQAPDTKYLILKSKIQSQTRKLKAARMRSYRARKKLATFKNIIKSLKNSDYLNCQTVEELEAFGELNKELLERQLKVARNAHKKRIVSECGQALKTFALTLNYYSPKAYEYVRKSFNNVLPHPKTLSRWYANLGGNPGFTQEAFETLKRRKDEKGKPVIGHVIFDEMNIKKKVEYDGTKYYGYVNNGIDIGSNELATQALVFMFVSANEAFKIPLGYFMVNSLSAEMKENLVKQCLASLHEAGVITLSLTFDGASSNLTLINNLGLKIQNPGDFNSMKTYFICPYSKRKIFIFYDMCHMFKLVRNILADKKVLFQGNNDKIEWKYFEDLLEIQEVEGLHLANKLKTQHIRFQNYKMKVKLASQLLSESVAEAFEVMKKLSYKDFPNSGPSIKFTRTFNGLFDVFNSKTNISVDLKAPINPQNFDIFEKFLKEAYEYIIDLKLENGAPVFTGKRKIGFLGFLISIKSLLDMYKYIMEKEEVEEEIDVDDPSWSNKEESEFVPLLTEICTHRFCQDHVEIFFGIIRQHGGHRTNPTSWQFCTAYKKCLVHLQLKEVEKGNCVGSEDIAILSCCQKSQKKKDSVVNEEEKNEECSFDLSKVHNVDHFYSFVPQELTSFTKIVVTYIAGSVIASCKKVLMCPACTEAMIKSPVQLHCELVEAKNSGGLITPGEETMDVAFVCEKLVRQVLANSGGRFIQPVYTTSKLVKIVLRSFDNEDLSSMFAPLNSNLLSPENILKHKSHLLSSFCTSFFNLRLRHISRKSVENAENKRNLFNKLCDFSGIAANQDFAPRSSDEDAKAVGCSVKCSRFELSS